MRQREIGSECLELRIEGLLVGESARRELATRLNRALEETQHVLLNLYACQGIDEDTIGLLVEMDGRFQDQGLDLQHWAAPLELRQRLYLRADL